MYRLDPRARRAYMQLPPTVIVPMPLLVALMLLVCAVILVRIAIHHPTFASALQAAAPFLAAMLAVLLAAWGLLE
jgi:hypothetical protein